jgi:hypothetical protein
MSPLHSLDRILTELNPDLTQKHICEKAATHPDFAMDAPDRQFDSFCFERFLPSEYVLIHAPYKRAIEIKDKCGFCARRCLTHESLTIIRTIAV